MTNEIETRLAERRRQAMLERQRKDEKEGARLERLSTLKEAFDGFEGFRLKGATVDIEPSGLVFSLDDVRLSAASVDGESFDATYKSSQRLKDSLKNVGHRGAISRDELIDYVINEFGLEQCEDA